MRGSRPGRARRARGAVLAAAAVHCLAAAGAAAQRPAGWNPTDSIRALPGYRPARDTAALLAPARIARLAPTGREARTAYVARSRAAHARDTAAMGAELRGIGRDTMARAPYARDFAVAPWMTPRWLAGDSARRLADAILSYQAPDGGWSKHVDYAAGPRAAGQSYFSESNAWSWIATLDNGATIEQLRFLAAADRARPDARYRAGFLRGLDFVLDAQQPSGCWPQVYPLEGSYHDAATFNDGAIVRAATLVREAAHGAYPFVPAATRARARTAAARAVDCVLDAQTVVGGALTVWGQQHDPLTLLPTSARSYEPTSLSGLESADVVRFLMSLPDPGPHVVTAVHAAARWFRQTALRDSVYDASQTLRAQPGAGPLWARLYEIGTDRPIFSNRDGIRLYDWDRLTDRRRGYAWFTEAPAAMLREYDAWARRHPAPRDAALPVRKSPR